MKELSSQPPQKTHGEAVIFGAGNIGRGFIGQLFSESGYQVTFVDIDQPLLDAINTRQAYPIQLVTNEKTEEVMVGPARALHSAQKDSVAEAVSRASIGATAVGARVLELIAPLVAAGMQKREHLGITAPLNLIICENLKGAAAVFRGLVDQHLPPELVEYAHAHLGLVDTVIGRMVPPPTPEMRAYDPSLIMVEPYKELPVDRNGFIGPIPAITGMEACDNFPAYTARKLYIHNCGHAILAYLGYLKGYQYGYEALADQEIMSAVNSALDESKTGVVAAYGVLPGWLDAHISDLLGRFTNRSLGDTIFRLGRDPLRKLAPSDRLVAPARLAEKAGVAPRAIARGIAAALRFDPAEDPIAQELQTRLASRGFDAVLQDVCAIQPSESLAGLVREAYHQW
jgi:mannitol-1-phosphate 5-dehydrogenase